VISEEIVSGTIDKLAVAMANKMPLVKLVQIFFTHSQTLPSRTAGKKQASSGKVYFLTLL
jgi:hypothetical protein